MQSRSQHGHGEQGHFCIGDDSLHFVHVGLFEEARFALSFETGAKVSQQSVALRRQLRRTGIGRVQGNSQGYGLDRVVDGDVLIERQVQSLI